MTAFLLYRKPPLLGCWLLFSIFLSVVLLREIIFSPGIPYTRDLVFPYDFATLGHMLGTWDDIHSQYNPEINKFPLFISLVAISTLLGTDAAVKLLFLIVVSLLTFIPFLSIYILFKDKVRSPIRLVVICSIPSLLYLFNPWVVDRISNHIYMVLGMAFTPLILVLFMRLLEKKADLASAILNGTILALILSIAAFSTHNLLYLVPLLLLVSAYYLVSQRSHRRWVILSSTVFFLIFAGLNSYWILPNAYRIMFANVQPSYDFSISEIQRLSRLSTPSNTIQMYGGGAWKEVIQIPPNNLASSALYALIPIFALAALVLFPRNKLVTFLGILFVIIFPLTLGTNSPFPIYDWLMSSPIAGILWLFRDPFRLVQITVMIFTILMAFSIYAIIQLRKNIFLFVLILAILYSPAAYTFYNAGGGRLVPSEIPSEYDEVREFLMSDSGSHKVLWLPLRQYQNYDWNRVNNEVAGDVYSVSSPVPTYSLTTTSSTFRFWNQLYSNVLLDYRTNNIGKILSTYDVKYVVVHKDLLGWQENEAERVINVLNLQQDLTLTKKVGEYYIYLNLNYKGDSSFSAYSVQDYEQFETATSLEPEKSIVDIFDLADWNSGPNNEVSIVNFEESPTIKLDMQLSESQARSEVRMSLNNADFEKYDKLSVQILPEGPGDPKILGIILYTNTSNFQFTRYDLVQSKWNDLIFDLRTPKLDQASISKDLNLRNVTGIGFVIFNKYYSSQTNYVFSLSQISLVPDASPIDTVALLDNWPSPENSNALELLKSENDRTLIKIYSTEPTMLILHESYDPLWKSTVKNARNTVQVDSVPAFGILNGFPISDPGEYEIEVYYSGQELVYEGAVVSGICAILVGLYLTRYRNNLKHQKAHPRFKLDFKNRIGNKPSDLIDEVSFAVQNPAHLFQLLNNISKLTVQRLSDYLIAFALSLLMVLPLSAILQLGFTADIITTFSFSLLAAGLLVRIIRYISVRVLPLTYKATNNQKMQ